MLALICAGTVKLAGPARPHYILMEALNE